MVGGIGITVTKISAAAMSLVVRAEDVYVLGAHRMGVKDPSTSLRTCCVERF